MTNQLLVEDCRNNFIGILFSFCQKLSKVAHFIAFHVPLIFRMPATFTFCQLCAILGDPRAACHIAGHALRQGCQVPRRRCQGGEAHYRDLRETNRT